MYIKEVVKMRQRKLRMSYRIHNWLLNLPSVLRWVIPEYFIGIIILLTGFFLLVLTVAAFK